MAGAVGDRFLVDVFFEGDDYVLELARDRDRVRGGIGGAAGGWDVRVGFAFFVFFFGADVAALSTTSPGEIALEEAGAAEAVADATDPSGACLLC